jgi:hypothetical protein
VLFVVRLLMYSYCAFELCSAAGAWDGKHLSNTHRLLKASADSSRQPDEARAPTGAGQDDGIGGPSVGQWRGLLVEADQERISAAEAMYVELGRPQRCVHATAGLTAENGIDALIKAHAPDIPSVNSTNSDGAHAASISVVTSMAATTVALDDSATSPVASSPAASSSCGSAGSPAAAAAAAAATATATDTATATSDVSSEFALLSIDVDGIDYWLWEAVQAHAPLVVIIEHNPTIPNHVVFVSDAACPLLLMALRTTARASATHSAAAAQAAHATHSAPFSAMLVFKVATECATAAATLLSTYFVTNTTINLIWSPSGAATRRGRTARELALGHDRASRGQGLPLGRNNAVQRILCAR